MTPPIETLLARLPDAKKSGNGWLARCPAHNDTRPSLSIGEGSDGRALVKCFAGCSVPDILTAIGLTLADLFPKTGPTPTRNGNPRGDGRTFASAADAVAALTRHFGRAPDYTWEYRNEHNDLVGLVLRWDRPNGNKDVRPVSCGQDGFWRIAAMPKGRPIYRLPELLLADAEKPVLIVEGELCVDAARSIGFVAVTSAGGSDAAHKSDWKPLAGKEVWILPDNDASGRKYAQVVAGILSRLTPPATVRIVELPGLPERGDIVDWINAHGDAAEPDAMRAEIEALARTVEPWRPDGSSGGSRWEPDVIRLADLEPKKVSWLWCGRLPLGRISLLVGRAGCGKSFLACDIAAKISTGAHWPDPGFDCAPLGDVLLLNVEDDANDTLRPRLDAAGADCRRVHLLRAAKIVSADGGERTVAFDLTNVDLIRDALGRLPDCKLVVVDPVGSFLGAGIDMHRDNEIRSVLMPLAAIASERGVAVMLICHTRKALAPYADDMTLGSRAFTGLARSVLHLMADPNDEKRKLLLMGKTNLSLPPPGLAFRIVGSPGRLEWEPDPVQGIRADDIVAAAVRRRSSRGPEAEALEEAATWLSAALANGPRLAKDLRDEWVHGKDGSERTLKRAKQFLQVEAYREQVPGPWWWRLPAKGANSTQDAKLGPLGPLEKLGPLGPLAKNKGKTAISDDGERKGAKFFILGPLGNPDRPAGVPDGEGEAEAPPVEASGVSASTPAAQGGLPEAEPRVEDPGAAEAGTPSPADATTLATQGGPSAAPDGNPPGGAPGPGSPPPTVRQPGLGHATVWLKTSLEAGPQPVEELARWWTRRGYDPALLHQAAAKLGVVEYQDSRMTYWRLPN
jgi:hypothetical protein